MSIDAIPPLRSLSIDLRTGKADARATTAGIALHRVSGDSCAADTSGQNMCRIPAIAPTWFCPGAGFVPVSSVYM
ncbi:hypothetical protein [Burkholderia metallica]|uniref:hypothetical protein n=1 Tax=Burkholderia metallica TaxID=488729 RepID=UPI001576A16A|nr:hypothetical protein [Burkholderia metallica]